MTVAKRLIILMAIPLVALLALGIFGSRQLSRVEERSRFVAESRIAAVAALGDLSRSVAGLRVEVRNYLLATGPALRSDARLRFDQHEQDLQKLLKDYEERLLFSEEGRRLLGEFRSLSLEWLSGAHQVMAMADEGRRDEAIMLLDGRFREVGGMLTDVLDDWTRNNEELAGTAAVGVVDAIEEFRTPMVAAIIIVALLMLGLAYVALLTRELLVQTQKQDTELQRMNFKADSALDLTKAGYWHVPLDDSGWYNSSERAARIYGDIPTPDHRYRLEDWARHVEEADAVAARLAFDNFSDACTGKIPRYDATYAYKRPVDGQVVWIHALGHVVKDAGGKPVDMYGVAQDITDFKLADQRVRETEQFYRSVLELAPDGLLVADRQGIIRLANLQCEKLFGYSREELLDQSVEMLVPAAVRAGHAALRESFHQSSDARPMGIGRELSGQRKDGTLFPIEVGLSPLPARAGQGTQVAVSIRDVSERKRQEREIIAARQKAEEATQMKSMFLANMSHEIRTPMNAIIGLSYLALKTPLSAKQRDYLSKVHNAGTSLLGVINDILDVSKIEAGKLEIETTDFKLDDVISSVTTLTGHKANEKGLELLAQISPGIPPFLRGDPLRLGQVLTNLVNNAIKFTDRGEVHVTAAQIEQTGGKCQLRFSVRDTGTGISKEQAARLFQPFTQADMSTTRVHGGTGLGLTICKRLVELMGGQISMESEPGVGTTFTFTVWLEIGHQKGSGKVVPEKLGKLRTLVVDDNAAAREIMEELLSGIVRRTDVASSAAEAISDIRQQDREAPYDVVFMDWRMPNMDGLEASQRIRNDATLKNSPAIIMVTAFGVDEVRDEAERMGLDGFLVKPVTKSMIVDALVSVFADPADQQAAVAAATGDGVRLASLRVLLVEDNAINQQIAVELLEGVGAAVEVAANGQESVDRLFNGPIPAPFDVVLMDLQMPVMDGHQATAKIRSDPRFASLPIIAMTAHATLEERQHCLASGMNDHIGKPIDPGLLFETLARFHKLPAASIPGRTPSDEILTIEGLDTKDGLARVGGNRKLYLKLLRQFVEEQAETGAEISRRLSGGDTDTAQRLAHTLKGLAGSLGAKSLQAAAAAVEKGFRNQDPPQTLEPIVRTLQEQLEPLIASLKAALGQPESAPAGKADPVRGRVAAGQLMKLLDDFDASAVDFIEANAVDLRSVFTDAATWDQFQRHARGFAFADAQALLKAALAGS